MHAWTSEQDEDDDNKIRIYDTYEAWYCKTIPSYPKVLFASY